MNKRIPQIKITKAILPPDSPNRPGVNMQPQWITLHDTGNTSKGANAAAHAAYLKGDVAASLPVSWHFTVDDLGAYQHLPTDEHGLHAGDGHGPGNTASIGIEICENSDGDRTKAEANAARLVALLLIQSRLDIDRVTTHKRWSGKDCPRILLTRWPAFLEQVRMTKYLLHPEPWDPAMEIAILRSCGITNSDHRPGDFVTWGEFATVMNRILR